MGVLHIVHGVVQAALFDQLQVEIQRAVALARKEHEARRVHAYFLEHVRQSFKGARARGHAHGLAVAQQVDQLDEHHVKIFLRPSHGGDGGAHARHVAVVVRAPDVNAPLIAAGILVVMVGDVRGEVGEAAVGLAQHPVLVVPQLLGGEPEGSVLFVGIARLG